MNVCFQPARGLTACFVRQCNFTRHYSLIRRCSAAPRSSLFHSSTGLLSKKRKGFFSSNATPRFASQDEPKKDETSPPSKRRTTRSPAAKNSLRRVAVEAQRSRDGRDTKKAPVAGQQTLKTLTAICAAQEYDIAHIVRILEGFGHQVDPYGTDLYPQVVHVALPVQALHPGEENTAWSTGDLFVFPSGTIVAWDIPDAILQSLVTKALLPAAESPLKKAEEEDMEYTEDPKRENSSIKGDRIILGTKHPSPAPPSQADSSSLLAETDPPDSEHATTQNRNLDSVLAKIAFSSGLARSTKLAVLESLLSDYFESTKSIPDVLSRGGRMPFTRSFISQKTGQLLSIRAQLNLYSELTDSLPDLFWDSRHELGLEGYYDQVGKALDTNIRIKVLNEKMDYAQEIASVLRQQLSEKHGIRLEWIIILLIAVEVVFAIDKEVKEFRNRRIPGTSNEGLA